MSVLQSPPTTAEILSEEKIYKAIKDLELILFKPDVDTAKIFAGNQNDISLPAGSNEYVINTIIRHEEHGTPVEHYEFNQETQAMSVAICRLIEIVLQVDCYSSTPEPARLRAESLSAITRTTSAVDFMRKYGISSLYASPPSNTTVVIDADEYVHRWTTEVHFSYTHKVLLDVDSFNAATVEVKNVDVHFLKH